MKTFSAVCVIAVLAASSSNGFAADSFDQSIRPLLRDYCVTCHSTEKQEGELDLERFNSLDPAREFPVDGAAGEGFTNVGAALVMSPALLSKYLEAAKDVASHMVLTPTGIRA